MKTKPQNPSLLLENLIEAKEKSLQKYALKPNANQHYIENQNKEIQSLYFVMNYLDNLKYLENWTEIEQIMYNSLQMDKNIQGFIIYFPLNLNSDLSRYCLIDNLLNSVL